MSKYKLERVIVNEAGEVFKVGDMVKVKLIDLPKMALNGQTFVGRISDTHLTKYDFFLLDVSENYQKKEIEISVTSHIETMEKVEI